MKEPLKLPKGFNLRKYEGFFSLSGDAQAKILYSRLMLIQEIFQVHSPRPGDFFRLHARGTIESMPSDCAASSESQIIALLRHPHDPELLPFSLDPKNLTGRNTLYVTPLSLPLAQHVGEAATVAMDHMKCSKGTEPYDEVFHDTHIFDPTVIGVIPPTETDQRNPEASTTEARKSVQYGSPHHAYAVVDLTGSIERIEADFSTWLKHTLAAKPQNIAHRNATIEQAERRQFLLPLIDLALILGPAAQVYYTKAQLAALLTLLPGSRIPPMDKDIKLLFDDMDWVLSMPFIKHLLATSQRHAPKTRGPDNQNG